MSERRFTDSELAAIKADPNVLVNALARLMADDGFSVDEALALVERGQRIWWGNQRRGLVAMLEARTAKLGTVSRDGAVEPPGKASARRRRGRPPGTRTLTKAQIVETYRTLKLSYGRQPTQQELVANMTPRIEVRALQDHLGAYELPWPIE